MRIKIGVIILGFLLVQMDAFGQNAEKSKDGFYYNTVTIMDYTTNEASERVSRMRKPVTYKFYLKADDVSYSLFSDNVASLTADQVLDLLDSGFSLYVNNMEHQDHKNLKPSTMEVLDENNNVDETIEALGQVKESTLKRKLKEGAKVRFSGFIISVNEDEHGPILMTAKIVE